MCTRRGLAFLFIGYLVIALYTCLYISRVTYRRNSLEELARTSYLWLVEFIDKVAEQVDATNGLPSNLEGTLELDDHSPRLKRHGRQLCEVQVLTLIFWGWHSLL